MSNEVISLSGIDALRNHIRYLRSQFSEMVKDALKQEAEIILADSKDNYVPVRTGTLRDSGKVTQVTKSGDKYSVSIIYDTDYAVYVHESHKSKKRKYLEKPIMNAADDLPDRLARRIKL